jgi:hypothetical protein
MATIALRGESGAVSLGRVFSRGFGTIITDPAAAFGIAFLFGGLAGTAAAFVRERLELRQDGLAATLAITLLTMVLGTVASSLAQGGLVRATIAHSEGRSAGFRESAMASLTAAIPLSLMGLIVAIGITVGTLLLILPGIALCVMWAVAAPALVAERLGPYQAISRSMDLTEGARWKVLGMELVLVTAWTMLVAAVASMRVLWSGLPGAIAPGGFSVSYWAIEAAVRTVTALGFGLFHASMYVELREWKEGPATDALENVFR